MKSPPAELVELFRAMKVDEPEQWASSEFNEGVSQITRGTVLRNVADLIVKHSTKESVRYAATVDTIFGAAAVQTLDERGADWDAISEVCMQVLGNFMWEYFRMMDGMDVMPVNPARLDMSLVSFDADGTAMGEAKGLYESLYHMLRHVTEREKW